MVFLLTRRSAGISVTIAWDALTDDVVLICQGAAALATVTVPRDKPRDAFEHPACYLSREQQQAIFLHH